MCQEMSRGAFLITAALVFAIFPLSSDIVSAEETAINCRAHDGECSLPLGEATVTFEIEPRPVTAMRDSTFTIVLSGSPPEQAPYIDLGMPAMQMGPNRVRLKSVGNGHYKGQGVIVRCKSGRRTWFANVIVPGKGEVKFIFDVVY